MSNAKHTPGPWQETAGQIYSVDRPIAQVNIVTNGDEMALANARLIAAAPDLIEALQQISDVKRSLVEARRIARAAIRKALGGGE